jgi:thiamine-phosphate pyrophosphorylase
MGETAPKSVERLRCCLITDRRKAVRPLPDLVREAAAGGVRFVQVREKDLPARRLLRLAREILAAVEPFDVTVVINDRIDVAEAAGAHGVHLGGESLPPAEARRLLGTDAWIGVSTHGVEEALAAERGGADYVTFGPIHETPSKAGILRPTGAPAIAAVRRRVTIPILALGGMRPERVAEAMAHGASGVAVVSFLVESENPREDAARLVRAAATPEVPSIEKGGTE